MSGPGSRRQNQATSLPSSGAPEKAVTSGPGSASSAGSRCATRTGRRSPSVRISERFTQRGRWYRDTVRPLLTTFLKAMSRSEQTGRPSSYSTASAVVPSPVSRATLRSAPPRGFLCSSTPPKPTGRYVSSPSTSAASDWITPSSRPGGSSSTAPADGLARRVTAAPSTSRARWVIRLNSGP